MGTVTPPAPAQPAKTDRFLVYDHHGPGHWPLARTPWNRRNHNTCVFGNSARAKGIIHRKGTSDRHTEPINNHETGGRRISGLGAVQDGRFRRKMPASAKFFIAVSVTDRSSRDFGGNLA